MSEETRIKLDVAPPCGPHNYYGNISNGIDYSSGGTYQFNGPYAFHWSGPNIIHSYYSRQTGYIPGGISLTLRDDHTDFNGIDYMVLFNLYSLQDFYLPWMFNSYYKENFSLDFPDKVGSAQETGSFYRQLKLNFLEYVSAVNKVNSDGYFTMRCGKVIDLKPGFESQTGSRFLAYIDDYHIDCGDRETHRPSEEYHYAEINQKPGWPVFTPLSPQNQSDTTYFLDFPPDGVPYVPDSATLTGPDTVSLSCEDQIEYLDSLISSIYSSGDQNQIDFLDSVLPYLTIPECDSIDVLSYMHTSSGSEAGNNEKQAFFGQQIEAKTALINKILDREKVGISFNIYPNPSNGHFTVAFAEIGNYDLRLSNSQGIVIFTTHVYSRRSEVVHLDGLPAGSYLLEVVSSDREMTPQRKKLEIYAD